MNPYRRSPPIDDSPAPSDDERTILWIAVFVGLLPVMTALFQGGVWGAEPTIGLLLCLLGGGGLLARARETRRERRGRAGGGP